MARSEVAPRVEMDPELVLIERLSDLEHRQWSEWASRLMLEEDISRERKERWKELIRTPFEKLDGANRYQDKRWAMQVMDILWDMGQSRWHKDRHEISVQGLHVQSPREIQAHRKGERLGRVHSRTRQRLRADTKVINHGR